ncbi:hypothetical protein L6452_22176 [Arctium lappa]|uniref:Uncharacterized protein n=1 Tax=Arctium lappa TaxID=4217 RepID=A0ACB9AYP1_ARCLA|nr:hypothetical protein L6452_22176 [Arctium lappa]
MILLYSTQSISPLTLDTAIPQSSSEKEALERFNYVYAKGWGLELLGNNYWFFLIAHEIGKSDLYVSRAGWLYCTKSLFLQLLFVGLWVCNNPVDM